MQNNEMNDEQYILQMRTNDFYNERDAGLAYGTMGAVGMAIGMGLTAVGISKGSDLVTGAGLSIAVVDAVYMVLDYAKAAVNQRRARQTSRKLSNLEGMLDA